MAKNAKSSQKSVYMLNTLWNEVAKKAGEEKRSDNKVIEMILEEYFKSTKK